MRTITLEEHFLTPAYVEATTRLSIGNESNPRMKSIQEKQLDIGAGRLADYDKRLFQDSALPVRSLRRRR